MQSSTTASQWLLSTLMNTGFAAHEQLLAEISRQVTRMDEWGYGLALRFEAYDRLHGQAHMVSVGNLTVSCGFHVDRAAKRHLFFGIELVLRDNRCELLVTAGHEDANVALFRWAAPTIVVAAPDQLAGGFDRAFAALDTAIALPEISEQFAAIRARPAK
jgi:hypothetical protein